MRFLFVLIAMLVALGCDGGMSSTPDSSVLRDAAFVDASGLLDSGAPRDAGPTVSDAGVSYFCQYEVCDPRYPDGCPDGSCVLVGESSSCEAAPGSHTLGMSCGSVMDCAPGLACFLSAEGGVCGRICCPNDVTACADGMLCAGSGVLVDGTETGWGQCLPARACDVLHPQEACETREGCYIVGADGSTECRVAGTGGPGAYCAAQEECQSGFFCGGIGDNRHCVRICQLGADDCPPEEGRCVAQAHSPAGTGFCTLDALTAR